MGKGYSDSFARAYHRAWTDFADRVGPKLVELYKSTEPGQAGLPVLDLCCGTGTAALHFLFAGFEVTGIDLSAAMLDIAKQNAREFVVSGKARFIIDDAQSFEPLSDQGLIYSTYNSLNHLPNFESLKNCLERCYQSLVPGGLLVFDLNTLLHLKAWDMMEVDDDPEMTMIRRGGFDDEGGRAFMRITGFMHEGEGVYSRFEQFVVERVFPCADVVRVLSDCGFSRAHMALEDDLTTALDDPESESTVFFVAEK